MGAEFGYKSTAEDVTEGIDLTGKTAIVTGGNCGLGEETARVLALRGADVVIACRKVESGKEAKERILAKHSNALISVLQLDLSSSASVRKFAKDFMAMGKPLHILINNGGCMAVPYALNAEGHEMHFATNHLGHFLLTNLLLDNIKRTATASATEGRIVNVSSCYHEEKHTYKEGIRFNKLDSKDGYSQWKAYGQSKLANVLHANELAKRLKADGVHNVTANSLHPGYIKTNLLRHAVKGFAAVVFDASHKLVLRHFWKSIPQGAATTCYVASSPALQGVSGRYFVDCKQTAPSKHGQDEAMAARLWDVSEKLVQ